MKLRLIVLLTSAWLVAPTLGQPPPQERPRGSARLQRQTPEGRPAGGLQARIDRIREALELDEDQQAEFDRIAAEFRERRGSGPDRERMRSLMEEMRRAHQEGNSERVAEIREELRDARGGDRIQEFLDEIEGILHDDQREKLAGIRERIATERRRGQMAAARGPARGGPVAQLRRLRAELQLTEKQAERYDELYAELQEALAQQGPREDVTKGLVDELIKAVEAGDEARIAELKEQLSGPHAQNQEAIGQFLAQVEEILEPGQVEILQRFRERMRMGRGLDDLEAMLRIVRRLDLNDEQRQRVREIRRENHQAAQEARRDPEAMAQLNAKVREELREVLTDEQVAEFDKLLESQRSDKSRRGRDADRPRGAHRRGSPKRAGDETP
jgi:predicted house-cleaning noncanonical NTP pyrophosphatase (MazG superfamily)